MDRKQLEILARSAAFIPHVYDYCDQCCQECPAAARCLRHHVERMEDDEFESGACDTPGGRPLSAREFFRIVAGATGTAVAVFDVLLADAEAAAIAPLNNDPLELLANHYAIQAGALVRSRDAAAWEEPNDRDADALTTIAWFQMLVPEKIRRALVSAHRAGGEVALLEDTLASAKLVLTSVERSRAALHDLSGCRPDVRISALVELLEAIALAVEQRFPGAAAYARPGLDDSASGPPQR